ncbi:MAG TPA: hypothetical protein VJT50_17110, partial [Pyrinomonadaceae bacterium]|nr:hypothetical protein [Pyrinomonadaceae bacterium]
PVSEVTVVLTDLSDKVHPTYLFVPSARVTNAESIDASTVSLMIVVDFGSQVPDHKLIAEHFAKDPQRGDFHIRMDLPEGIIGIDLRDPGRFTAEELRANGNHKNMELMAASLYKERGKAIYDRYYRELTALRASKIVRGRIIGQVDGNGAFRSSESRN